MVNAAYTRRRSGLRSGKRTHARTRGGFRLKRTASQNTKELDKICATLNEEAEARSVKHYKSIYGNKMASVERHVSVSMKTTALRQLLMLLVGTASVRLFVRDDGSMRSSRGMCQVLKKILRPHALDHTWWTRRPAQFMSLVGAGVHWCVRQGALWAMLGYLGLLATQVVPFVAVGVLSSGGSAAALTALLTWVAFEAAQKFTTTGDEKTGGKRRFLSILMTIWAVADMYTQYKRMGHERAIYWNLVDKGLDAKQEEQYDINLKQHMEIDKEIEHTLLVESFMDEDEDDDNDEDDDDDEDGDHRAKRKLGRRGVRKTERRSMRELLDDATPAYEEFVKYVTSIPSRSWFEQIFQRFLESKSTQEHYRKHDEYKSLLAWLSAGALGTPGGDDAQDGMDIHRRVLNNVDPSTVALGSLDRTLRRRTTAPGTPGTAKRRPRPTSISEITRSALHVGGRVVVTTKKKKKGSASSHTFKAILRKVNKDHTLKVRPVPWNERPRELRKYLLRKFGRITHAMHLFDHMGREREPIEIVTAYMVILNRSARQAKDFAEKLMTLKEFKPVAAKEVVRNTEKQLLTHGGGARVPR